MKRSVLSLLMAAAVVLVTFGAPASASGQVVGTGLSGFQEVPVPISTTGSGAFFARIHSDGTQIDFVLVYEDLQGGTVNAAHIHFGQIGVAGGIAIHLCGTGGKPACPPPPAVLSGVLTSQDVVAIQGIAAGDLAAVINAIRAGQAYANVHTATFPAGEVRGQIRLHH